MNTYICYGLALLLAHSTPLTQAAAPGQAIKSMFKSREEIVAHLKDFTKKYDITPYTVKDQLQKMSVAAEILGKWLNKFKRNDQPGLNAYLAQERLSELQELSQHLYDYASKNRVKDRESAIRDITHLFAVTSDLKHYLSEFNKNMPIDPSQKLRKDVKPSQELINTVEKFYNSINQDIIQIDYFVGQ